MVDNTLQTIRIFVSSPGDVKDERARVVPVIDSLRRRYAQQFQLEPLFWEDMPLTANQSFQQGIDWVLSDEQGVDIAVFILWARFGSPTGPSICKSDGSEYLSGTEREYDLMKQASVQSRSKLGHPQPQILIYTRHDDASFDERLKGISADKQLEPLRQKTLVEDFIKNTFNDPESGINVGAYHTYEHPKDFCEKLRFHLMGLLDKMGGVITLLV